MTVETQSYRYRVDKDDRLIGVDALWLAFAKENGAAELTEASVLGRSLWDFVEGEAIRAIYSEIHARVRSSGKTAVFPYRCDSPTLKRYMRMSIQREEAGQLTYDSHVVWAEPQRRLTVLDADRQRSKSFLTICSFCKKAILDSAGWLEVESACVSLGILEAEQVPQLRYTICPKCSDTVAHCIDNDAA